MWMLSQKAPWASKVNKGLDLNGAWLSVLVVVMAACLAAALLWVGIPYCSITGACGA